jgi:hypothetical protein
MTMNPAATFNFERIAKEYARWRSVPNDDRSAAPGWWWQPAFEVAFREEPMSPLLCAYLEIPFSSTYAAGAAAIMAALVDQKTLPRSDEFPRRQKAENDCSAETAQGPR